VQTEVRVSSVVPGGPADRAGVRAGDVIRSADGEDCAGLSPEEVSKFVRGAAGSKLRLALRPAGEEAEKVLLIERAEVGSAHPRAPRACTPCAHVCAHARTPRVQARVDPTPTPARALPIRR
jgi:hypothetical protein